MPSSVFILVDKDNRVLMETRGPDDKYFPNGRVYPGGKVNPGEQSWQAMRRECKEELGVTACAWGPMLANAFLYYKPFILNVSGTAEGDLAMSEQKVSYLSPVERPELADFRVFPFLVTGWAGKLPDHILDTGHALDWYPLQEAATGDGCSVVLIKAIPAYLPANKGRR